MLAYEQDIFEGLGATGPTLSDFYRRLATRFPLVPIESKRRHKIACGLMTRLTLLENANEIPKDVAEDVNKFLIVLGLLIEDYENKHFPIDTSHLTPRDMLEFFMEQHGLSQTDLAEEFGGQGNVSKFLKGDRGLSTTIIKALSERFGVSTDLFIS